MDSATRQGCVVTLWVLALALAVVAIALFDRQPPRTYLVRTPSGVYEAVGEPKTDHGNLIWIDPRGTRCSVIPPYSYRLKGER